MSAPPPASRTATLIGCRLAVLLLFGMARIASTYTVFCQTSDEPFFIAQGMDWLTRGTYSYVEHPPLGPLSFAIGPLLDGASFSFSGNKHLDGNRVLYGQGNYRRTLALARLGNLAFFIGAALAVFFWCRTISGNTVALVATALFTTLPPVLGHAGLATNDIAVTCMLTWLLFSLTHWLQLPTWPRAVLLGLAGGLALLAKLSAVVFFLVAAAVVLVLSGPASSDRRFFSRRTCCTLILAVAVAWYVVWLGYGCSFGRPGLAPYLELHNAVAPDQDVPVVVDKVVRVTAEIPVPAPEFIQGLHCLAHKQTFGHAPYFLGKRRYHQGSLLFFPVVLAIKTPIAFMLLTAIGTAFSIHLARTRAQRTLLIPVLVPLAMLLAVLPSNINLGVRHVLPLYPFLSILAAVGVLGLWFVHRLSIPSKSAAVLLLGWHGVTGIATHPDYLAYFNALAGSHPEDFVVDSDLDWGQDLDRLSQECHSRGIKNLHLCYFGTADISRHDLPEIQLLPPEQPVHGWVAISLFNLKVRSGYEWLEDHRPVTLVGRSIRLYHIQLPPPAANQPASSGADSNRPTVPSSRNS